MFTGEDFTGMKICLSAYFASLTNDTEANDQYLFITLMILFDRIKR